MVLYLFNNFAYNHFRHNGICETFKISCLMRFGKRFNGPVIPFGAMAEYHLISAEDRPRLHQFGPKVLTGLFLGYVLLGYAVHAGGGICKGDILVAGIEELEQMDASEMYAKRLNAKEVLTPVSGEKFIFPIADGTVKISGGDQVLRTSTLIRDNPDRGEEEDNLQGESDGSSSTPLRDSSWYDGEARNDFRSMSGDFILSSSGGTQSQTVRAKRRILFYSTQKNRRYQDYRYILGCNVGEKHRRLLERWWRSRIVRNVDRFQKIHYIEWKTTGWIYMVREREERRGFWQENKRPPGQTLCGQRFGKICPMHRNAERSKSGLSRNQSSTLPEDCVVFTSLILMMRSSSVWWRMLVECWKFRWQLQCFASAGKPVAQLQNTRQKYACIVEADESMRIRMGRIS